MNLKLALRGFSFRTNFFILLALIIFLAFYRLLPYFVLGHLLIAMVFLSAITSVGPALLRRIRAIIPNILRRKYIIDAKHDEILNEAKNLCSLMGMTEIRDKIRLKVIPNLNNAKASRQTISIDKSFLEKFNQEEIKFILAHELAHIKLEEQRKHKPWYRDRYFFVGGIMALIFMVLLIFFETLHPFVAVTLFVVLIFMSIRFMTWPVEYEADSLAIQYTANKNAMESVLHKLVGMKETNYKWASYSHPSVSNRIANLNWPQRVKYKKWYLNLD